MPYPWSTFVTDFTAVVAATLPETVANGIYAFEEIARISWEVPPAMPYLVWMLAGAPEGDWGLANDAFEPVVQFHYLLAETEAQGADPLASRNVIRARLEALKNGLRAATFANSQAILLGFPMVDFSGLNAVNFILLGKNVPAGGGMLAARFTLGETAS
jgi:hypothetical protein